MIHRSTPAASRLFHEGSVALAEMSANGVRVDRGYLLKALDDTAQQILDGEEEMKKNEVHRLWQKRYGQKMNLESYDQLAVVMFDDLGVKSGERTPTGKRYKASEATFADISHPFVKLYFSTQKLRKARGTYLTGIHREMVEHDDGLWYVHPQYNLNTVATFRSSCENPNWTNIPVRNKTMAEMIRRCYIPRPRRQIIENDLAQIEVRVAAGYNEDPNLIAYCRDKSKDMHRDMAMQIYLLRKEEVSKEARHAAKNQCVFPWFYGSRYFMCAPHLWDAVARRGLKVEGTDISLRTHLEQQGIRSLGNCDPDHIRKNGTERGTFVHHLKEIEEDFWGKRFPVYNRWKERVYEEYQRDGGCMFLTGFAMTGSHARNDIINYRIQGAAFHCELWTIIEITKRLRRYKMKSLLIGEIHDCNDGDVVPRERDDYLDMVHEITERELPDEWRWINVPIEVESEVCPIDVSWQEKAEWVKRGDRWEPKETERWLEKYGRW